MELKFFYEKKNFDELEKQFNDAFCELDSIESLSRILIGCIYEDSDLKPKDVQNLISVLNEKILELKQKFNSIEQFFII